MTERDLYHRIMSLFKAPESHCQRIESTTLTGLPDLNICHMGMEVWVECKVGRSYLRKEQYAWGMRRAQSGGTVALVSYDNDLYRVWIFPFEGKPVGGGEKYVSPVEKPKFSNQELLALKKILFPCI